MLDRPEGPCPGGGRRGSRSSGADQRLVANPAVHNTATRARTGFTIVDLLVSMAVMMVLISLLLPSLASVRETANQVVCRSNVRQVGLGIQMYAEDRKDRVPYSAPVSGPPATYQPWVTNTIRFAGTGWDGLGLLFIDEYLPAPKLYYCPSHRGRYPYMNYSDAWATETPIEIVGNYQYRGRAPTGKPVGPLGTVSMTPYLSRMRAGAALVSDGLRSASDFNHEIGTNVLRADLGVTWFNDRGGSVLSLLAKDGQPPTVVSIEQAWSQLDDGVP
jgi:type II secretory pathway pseudopilin PulG